MLYSFAHDTHSKLDLELVFQFIAFNDDGLSVDHDGGPACPSTAAGITPRMQRPALNYGVSGVLKMRLAPVIQNQD